MPLYSPPNEVRAFRAKGLLDKVNVAQFLDNGPAAPSILHLDPVSKTLVGWAWYVGSANLRPHIRDSTHLEPFPFLRPCYPDGRRVPPDELDDYCLEYYYHAPCCLCPYIEGSAISRECRIRLMESVNPKRKDRHLQPFIGEYVAECANEEAQCGYFSESKMSCGVLSGPEADGVVILERFYGKKPLLQTRTKKRRKS